MMYPFQIPLYENYNPKVLLIVDVQEEFCEFFPCDYLKKIYWFAGQFEQVYQIWDKTGSDEPSYKFENQIDTIVKEYGGDIDESDIEYIAEEDVKKFKDDLANGFGYNKSNMYNLKNGGALFFIGMGEGSEPGHMWFKVNQDYMNFLEELRRLNADVVLVGGGKWECIYDVEVTLRESGINYNYNEEFVFDSSSGCPTQSGCELDKEPQEN